MNANVPQSGANLSTFCKSRKGKLREQQRQMNVARFCCSLHPIARRCPLQSPLTVTSYQPSEDSGLLQYRSLGHKSMKEKANDLERKLYLAVRMSFLVL